MTNVDVIERPDDPAPAGSSPSPVADPAQKLAELRQRVVGTNIDATSFLSTDYFNMFNSIVMVMDMLPDAPDMLEEVEQWRFADYVQHFKQSGLDFSDLAVEAYAYAPPDLREAFEHKIHGIRAVIENTAKILRVLLENGELEAFKRIVHSSVDLLHSMIEEGNGIVHGGRAMDQSAIDNLF